MPFMPRLEESTIYREFVDTFAGRNHNAKIADGEFYETQNLTTRYYPLMATRAKRGMAKQLYSPGGIMDKVHLAYVDNLQLYLNDEPTPLGGLMPGEKILVPFGAYICVFPDKKYYNTADASDYGSMNSTLEERTLAAPDGFLYHLWESPLAVGVDHGHYLEHPDQTEDTFYVWVTLVRNQDASPAVTQEDLSAALEPLRHVGTLRLPIAKTKFELMAGTEEYDPAWLKRNLCTILGVYVNDNGATVEVSHADPATGLGESTGKYNPISGTHTIAYDSRAGSTTFAVPIGVNIIRGVWVNGTQLSSGWALDQVNSRVALDSAPGEGVDNVRISYCYDDMSGPDAGILISVPKKTAGGENTNIMLQSDDVPEMDYVIECKNRLWGCKYGTVNGENINEIYACELGNFRNWKKYEGISMDPYTASVGSDGPWTGAINYLGYPTFFKEDRIHRVAVSAIGAHEITETVCDGVQAGSSKSLGVVNGILYYKTNANVVIYQGGIAPASISAQMGDVHYYDAVAGVIGDDYYISMRDGADVWHLFCFDSKRSLWVREDNLHVRQFATVGEELYALTDDNRILALRGTTGTPEEEFNWYGESGILYYQYPDKKYVSRFNFRLQMDRGTRIRVMIEYDSSGRWEKQGEIITENLRTVTLPIRPRRCDHLRIRIEGRGNAKIFSLAKILEIGSDY